MEPATKTWTSSHAKQTEAWLADIGGAAWSAFLAWPRSPATMLAQAYRRPRRVVMLVTDVVGFSSLTNQLGDRQAQDVIHAHNQLLRACLRQHGGREVTHTGDGMIAAFHHADAAARCAIHMQTRLRELRERQPAWPLCVRMGLHAGRPLPEEGRLFGASVNFTVRVSSVAKSNEILISDEVEQLLGDGFERRAQAPVSLKGFEGLFRLHVLGWDGYRHVDLCLTTSL